MGTLHDPQMKLSARSAWFVVLALTIAALVLLAGAIRDVTSAAEVDARESALAILCGVILTMLAVAGARSLRRVPRAESTSRTQGAMNNTPIELDRLNGQVIEGRP